MTSLVEYAWTTKAVFQRVSLMLQYESIALFNVYWKMF